jgi:hypothetical protein
MEGAGEVTVKVVDEVAAPLGVVTEIFPVVAAAGTVVVICVALATLKVAAEPLKATAVAPVKFVPPIVTLVPAAPLEGEKLVIVGAGDVTVKALVELAVPPGAVTINMPLVAFAGTVAVICVALETVKVADAPLKERAVAPVRFDPVMVMLVPGGPD